MEQVLDVYKRPYDPRHPVVCMDESPRQLIRDGCRPRGAGTPRLRIRTLRGVQRVHGRRAVGQQENGPDPGTENQNGLGTLSQRHGYPCAEKITLVMDNLNTHGPGSHETTRRGQSVVGSFRIRVHPEARKLAQHPKSNSTSSSSNAWTEDRQSRPDPGRSGSLAEATKQRQVTNRLAVYVPMNQAQAFIRLLICDMTLVLTRTR